MFTITISTDYPDTPSPTDFTMNDLRLCTMITGKPDGKERCPVFHDLIPWKSCTVIVPLEHEDAARYWLDALHGAGCIQWRKPIDHRSVALRSNYMAW